MTFPSREAAGEELGRYLKERGSRADIVLGLPRGGVVVASEVARILEKPLGVLVVRKIGHPHQREFAIGALAEPDVVLFDDNSLRRSNLTRDELSEVVAEETARLRDYKQKFHQPNEAPLAGKSVLIVDDGIATGATAEAAVLSAKKQNAREVFISAPVASTDAVARLRVHADDVIVLIEDGDFDAVGAYYDYFSQTTDAEVVALLHHA